LGARRNPARRSQPSPLCGVAATATAALCATVVDRLLSVACTPLEQQTLFDPPTRFGRPPREHQHPIPLFDRKRPFLRPDLPSGWQSAARSGSQGCAANVAASAEPAQGVLDRASTALPLPWRECTPTVPARVTLFFSLDHWWEVRSLHRRVYSELDFRGPTAGLRFAGNCIEVIDELDRHRRHCPLRPPIALHRPTRALHLFCT
jgi:hypothetical protein